MSSSEISYVFDQAEQTCVYAELADTFENLTVFERLPVHMM